MYQKFNPRAQPLFCSLNLLFGDILVSEAVQFRKLPNRFVGPSRPQYPSVCHIYAHTGHVFFQSHISRDPCQCVYALEVPDQAVVSTELVYYAFRLNEI